MSKIFLLKSDVTNYPFFLDDYNHIDEDMQGVAMRSEWKPFKIKHEINLELHANDYGRKKL